MEPTTKAEEKSAAESQVGPASEQVASVPQAQPTANEYRAPQKFSIPEEHKEPLTALAVVEEDWHIRTSCANTRRRLAMEAGDAETAIVETRNVRNSGEARAGARKDVEAAIRTAIPEIPAGGHLHMIIPDYEVHYTQN